ncbi:MAG TPA: recombinase family protein [Spongiibacteraceae bacterium]|nr:recombinase family protein [Spongiibacteraceae bacterium]
MKTTKYVIYYRVSTKKQGESGLGLEAQRRDIEIFLERYSSIPFEVLQEFTEVESGKLDTRPILKAAEALAKKHKAVLLVSKLDRLSRDVEFIAGVIKRCDVKVACMPNADRFQLHIYAALAEQEREFISQRTKQALQAAKARGVKLGGIRDTTMQRNVALSQYTDAFAERHRGLLEGLVAQGKSLRSMASSLNDSGLKTTTGKEFGPMQVSRMIERLQLKAA